MSLKLQRIDKFIQLSDSLAISGQPSESQFELIKEAGYQMVIQLKISEIEPSVANEKQLVEESGLLYEDISLSFNNPDKAVFDEFAKTINQYSKLKIYLHCTAGYCTSGLLAPYLVLYKNQSLEDVLDRLIVRQFNPAWTNFIHSMIAEYRAAAG